MEIVHSEDLISSSFQAFCYVKDSSSDDKTLNPREDLEVTVEVSGKQNHFSFYLVSIFLYIFHLVKGHLERCYHQTLVSDPDGVPMARLIISLRTR